VEKGPKIIIPTRPQPDTIVAIFLLKTFGEERFPGISGAEVVVKAMLSPGETFESLIQQGVVPLDIGGGDFDHHEKGKPASQLVAEYLHIEKDPALSKMLAYAKRDDEEGKGTLSADPIDRAFGLSALIASLNKVYPSEPQKVIDPVLPFLAAHYRSSREHRVELPREVEEKKKSGLYEELLVRQAGKILKLVYVVSESPAMSTFLRSWRGPKADVVVQKSESKNHVCIVSKQDRNVDLSKVMGLIRLHEGDLRNLSLSDSETYLCKTGRIEELPHWYFDPATNSILNGGHYNPHVEETLIDWEVMKKIIRVGLES